LCTKFGCVPQGSFDCGSFYCVPGQKCGTSGCVPTDAEDCGNGRYCRAGSKCASGGGCIRADAVDCGNGRSCAAGLTCVPASNECLTQSEIDRRTSEYLEQRQRAAAEAEARRQALVEAEARRRAAVEAEAARRAAAEAEARRRAAAEAEERRRIAEEEKTILGRLKKTFRETAATVRSLSDEALAGLLLAPLGLLALFGVAFRQRSRGRATGMARERSIRASAASYADTDQVSTTTTERHQAGSIPETTPGVVQNKDDEGAMADLGTSGLRPEARPGLVKVRGIKIHGTYATASSIASLFGFVGWTLVVIGILLALGGLSGGAQSFGIALVPIGIAIAAIGLMQVAAQQLLRASIDSADYARQSFLLQVALAEGRTDIDLS
jgi:hypothetical protein